MRPRHTAAAEAMGLLHRAATYLNTASPASARDIGRIMDAAMPEPVGHPGYRDKRFLLQPHFSETAADSLSFVMDTGGPGATGYDRLETATRAMSEVVGNHFGGEALNWFRGRSEPLGEGSRRAVNWGAWFGTGLDRNGVTEAAAMYEWGPGMMDSLPSPLFRIARVAMESLPSLRPAFSTIRCGRSSGSQQITFEVEHALPLAGLQPLMQNLGLGHQHASLMSACALVLGARFTLPPETATVTLRPTRTGVELRLDVLLDALPDVPSQMISLLRLQMGERPRSLRALTRWLTALTPEGYPGPGNISVLSVWVRPDMPARVALYLRPAALEPDGRPAAPRPHAPSGHGPAPVVAASSREDWAQWSPT